MNSILSARGLTKSFEKHIVFKNLTFEVPENTVFTILGKNGAGKTTLINLMLNILTPDSGEVYYRGKKIKLLGNTIYNDFSAVLESIDNLYEYLSGKQNIEYSLSIHKIKPDDKKRQMNELIELFELQEDIHKKVGTYSRGMRQKVSLICTLLHDSKLLFLDEPTLGLDFQANHELLQYIRTDIKQAGKTVILTTHQADVLENVSEYLLLLDDGSIVYQGKYSSFKEQFGTVNSSIEEILIGLYKGIRG
jgi:ABC-2 type transport system ATP-binding protein